MTCCHECKKDFPIINDEPGLAPKRECYWLSGQPATKNKTLCVDCWESSDKEQYKQQFEEIILHRERSPDGFHSIFSHEDKYIQRIVKCEEKGCGKKFDAKTAEKYRHKYDGNSYDYGISGVGKLGLLDNKLLFYDHEMLNKNPAPVKTMEDLVQQWMTNEGYAKIYYDTATFKAEKRDGKILDFFNFMSAWQDKVEEWLKTQPNKEFVNKGGDNPEREREREHFGLFHQTPYQIHYFKR